MQQRIQLQAQPGSSGHSYLHVWSEIEARDGKEEKEIRPSTQVTLKCKRAYIESFDTLVC